MKIGKVTVSQNICNLRTSKNQLRPSAHKTSKFECSPSYAGALLYNKLPKELIAEEKLQILRHKN